MWPSILERCLLQFSLFLVLLIPPLLGCEGCGYSASANEQYIRSVLGPIVLQQIVKDGEAPDTLEQALKNFSGSLAHRGDYKGNSLAYIKLGKKSFCFVSGGPNGKIEMGKNDDLVVCYENGQWRTGRASDIASHFSLEKEAD